MYEKERRLIRMMKIAENMADQLTDGHFTIFHFTTGWKIMFGSPELTVEFDEDFKIKGGGYSEVQKLPNAKSLEEALENLLGDVPHCERDHCCPCD